MKMQVKNLEELQALAEGFLAKLAEMPTQKNATVVGLSGDLGAGKTAFTKCTASILGISEVVTSPTFILEKIYIIPHGVTLGEKFLKLIHIDAYRLEGGDEMRPLGWEALLGDPQNLIFLEWPEQVTSALPKEMINISFEYVSEGVRNVTY